jgi:uncharacterized membrane protein
MTQYTTAIIINASQEAVWKVFSDVTCWHEWTPTVSKVEVIDQPELKLGHRFKVFQPKLQPAEWTVTVLEPPSKFIWESKAPGMHMIAEHIMISKAENQTEVTLVFIFKGWFGNFISKFYGKTAQAYIQREAQALKTKVENL